jgi:hypothetical protein
VKFDRAAAGQVLRGHVADRVEAMGGAMVKDLKDEVSDQHRSRPTIHGWPLRKVTGKLQRSITDEVAELPDGVRMVLGREIMWYGGFWELVGRFNKRFQQFRLYPWFWPTLRRNWSKYMEVLGVENPSPLEIGRAPVGGPANERSNFTARRNWRRMGRRKP